MSNVQTQARPAEPAKGKAPQIGFLSGASIERAFIVGLYFALLLLALLGVLGTFYGMRSQPAPLAEPGRIIADIGGAPTLLGAAFGLQLALTLAQYGARQRAKRNPRWWMVYLAALAWSGYYNVVAYYEPAVALGMPWAVALALILGGDVIPELVAVKE